MRGGIFGTAVGEWAVDRRYSSLRGVCHHILPCTSVCMCVCEIDIIKLCIRSPVCILCSLSMHVDVEVIVNFFDWAEDGC
jgi:hypothetical protein